MRPTRFAVLNNDNVSPRIVSALFNHIGRIVDPYREARLRKRRRQANQMVGSDSRSIPLACPRFITQRGQNASDLALTVDAMDVLHCRRATVF